MTFSLHATGVPKVAIDEVVPGLVGDLVASRITAGDTTLWGEAAEAEAAVRLGWVEAVRS
ncbi:MAG TPA: glucose-6-phosphate isomerase, partial [Microbacterium sp.]|nr:glucose-6-phosphate isomerase [Microbacterium sp.]